MHKAIPFSDFQPEEHHYEIMVVCHGVALIENIGSLFRLADSAAISGIHFLGIKKNDYNWKKIKRISRNTSEAVNYRVGENYSDIKELYSGGKGLHIALEMTGRSQSIFDWHEINRNCNQSLILHIGSELRGIPEEVLEHIEQHVHIPMFGRNSSMNVIQSTGIAIYYILRG